MGKQLKIKYYGGYSVNNGSTYGAGYEFTNLKQACKDMRDIASGNVYQGNSGKWHVTDLRGNLIKSGRV